MKKVLSLFDGISGAQKALHLNGETDITYIASEIDQRAIEITKSNFPNTLHLGDVTKLDYSLPQFQDIDLLIGGSPCTDLSFAGNRAGLASIKGEITSLDQYLELKADGVEFVGQSYLFWEYIRALREVKPKYFLLENTQMVQKWRDIFTKELGVEPIMINSLDFVPQSRKRFYWCNWDVGIIESKDPTQKRNTNEKTCTVKKYNTKKALQKIIGKKKIIARRRGRRINGLNEKTVQMLEVKNDYFANTLTTVKKDNVIVHKKHKGLKIPAHEFKDEVQEPTAEICEQLQGFPAGYTRAVKESPAIRGIGNSFTPQVIAFILGHIK